jgi:tetratricopeptide (TPR) repeat protein
MNVFDWLGQVQRLFRYARSWSTLFTSLGIACILTGITVDFLYSSLYRRIYNTPHTNYGLLYWVLLLALSVTLPLSYAVYRIASWRWLKRAFKPDTLGIAITQFEVWSGGSGQSSGSDRANAISEVIPSFLQTARSRLSDDLEWSAAFSLRFLPPTIRIRTSREAENMLRRQSATLVIWGLLVPKSDGKMQVELHFTGQDLSLRFNGDIDSAEFLDIGSQAVRFNSLIAAALAARKRQDYATAIKFMDMALPTAADMDGSANNPKEGSVRATMASLRKAERLAVACPDRYSVALGTSLTHLGGTLSRLGRAADALIAEQRAVAVFRTLADASPGPGRPALAAALASLGGRLSDQGRLADAVPVIGEAVDSYRQLAAASPDQYRPSLAASLADLGAALDKLSRPADALPVLEEAVGMYRILADTSQERYCPALATSLARLGTQLSAAGRPADALPVLEEAVDSYRELDGTSGDVNRYIPELAASLTKLGSTLNQLGRPADALAAQQDMVALGRDLAADDPDRYLSDLAISLIGVASTLDLAGRPADALPVSEEAVSMWRQLAAASPDRCRNNLATSLATLGARLSSLGRQADALKPLQEAVAIYRELPESSPGPHRFGLALSLSELAGALRQLERPADAVPVLEEVVGIFRELAAENPALHGPDVAISLFNLGEALDLAGRSADAVPVTEEAAGIFRELAAGQEQYRSHLELALGNAARFLAALGRQAEADAARGEIARLDKTSITSGQAPSE